MVSLKGKKEIIVYSALKGRYLRTREWEKRSTTSGEVSHQTFYNIRRRFLRDNLVKKVRKEGAVYTYCSEDEEEFGERLLEKKAEKVDIQLKMRHTKKVKDIVVRPWIQEIKKLYVSVVHGFENPYFKEFRKNLGVQKWWDGHLFSLRLFEKKKHLPGLYPWNEAITILENEKSLLRCAKLKFFEQEKWFSFEKEILFEDFKNHVRFLPNPFDELERFKKSVPKFEEKRWLIQDEIWDLVKQVFPSNTSPRDFDHSHLSYLDWWIFTTLGLKENFNLARKKIIWLPEEQESSYTNSGLVVVYIGREGKDIREFYSPGVVFGELGKPRVLSWESFQKIKKILEEVAYSTSSEFEDLFKLERKSKTALKNMEKSLEKHLIVEVFPEECEYFPFQ
jgi:hypothetical protein